MLSREDNELLCYDRTEEHLGSIDQMAPRSDA